VEAEPANIEIISWHS